MLAPVTKRIERDGFVFSNAAARAGSAAERSAAAATVRVVLAGDCGVAGGTKKRLSRKKATELDNRILIFDTRNVLK